MIAAAVTLRDGVAEEAVEAAPVAVEDVAAGEEDVGFLAGQEGKVSSTPILS